MDNIEYYPCDLSPESFNQNFEGNIEVKKVNVTDIPYEDNCFDVILCNHVLEHVTNDSQAMAEIYRVLKNRAFAILQVPIDYRRNTTYEDFNIIEPAEREKAFGQYDHCRIYGKDYKYRLEKAGFNVCEDNFVKTFSKKEIFKYGLDASEKIYYCQKG